MSEIDYRSIDAKVAILLGWQNVRQCEGWAYWFGYPPNSMTYEFIPCYSRDIDEALRLLEHFKLLLIRHDNQWVCGKFTDTFGDGYFDVKGGVIDGHLEAIGVAETIPLAICLSAIALCSKGEER